MSKQNNENQSKWQKFAEEQEQQGKDQSNEAGVQLDEADQPVDSKQTEPSSDLPDGSTLELNEALTDLDSVADLQNQVKALQMQMETYKDQAARAAAEMENTRRRSERDVSNAHKYGNEKLVSELLPIIDSLVRAQEGVDAENEQAQSMVKGMAMTLELLESTLTKFGLKVIAPESGEAFNPECHEAMSMVPNADLPKNSVMQLLQKGYELNGRVIRAAMVIVTQ